MVSQKFNAIAVGNKSVVACESRNVGANPRAIGVRSVHACLENFPLLGVEEALQLPLGLLCCL